MIITTSWSLLKIIPAEDDLVGNLWGGAVSLWGRAREKTFEALDKAHQDGWVPKDHNEFFSNVGDAVGGHISHFVGA